jgi:hypothetical protein
MPVRSTTNSPVNNYALEEYIFILIWYARVLQICEPSYILAQLNNMDYIFTW